MNWSGPAAYHVDYDYLVTGEVAAIREKGATSGVGVLAVYGYDDLGRRTSLARGNGTVTGYTYDPVSRLQQLTQDLAGTANDLTLGFTYNPASQIASNTRSNDLYSWTQHGSGTTSTAADGLNRIGSWNDALGYDGKGNIAAIGTAAYGYSSENLMISAPGYTLAYDPLTRFYELQGTSGRRRVYDGDELIAEYHPTGALARRFVHGPGTDEPLVWYGSGGAARRFLHADERGSIVSATDGNGNPIVTYRYDEYGGWGSGNSGTFFYTGQTGYAELGLYYYKNRWRHPKLDRFMQTDPIGYGGGMNMYAYVKGDPVNFTDPLGLKQDVPDIIINGRCNWVCKFRRMIGNNIGEGSSGSTSTTSFELPIASTAMRASGPAGGRPGKAATKAKKKPGEGCNQQVLDAAHGVQDFSESLNKRSNEMLVIAGVAAVAGVPLTASVVGAPAGAVSEITAGGIATVALAGKSVAGVLNYGGDLVARIETGTQRGFGSSLFSAAASIIPGGSAIQDIVQDQVNDAAGKLVNSEAPRSCPG